MKEQAPHRPGQQSPGRKFMRLATEFLAAGLVAFNWFATQRAAAAMAYAPFLTGRIVAHVYQPFAWFWWQHQWPNNALRIGNHVLFLAPLWRSCEHMVMYPMLVIGGIAALCSLFLTQGESKADLHGSATWAGIAQIRQAGLFAAGLNIYFATWPLRFGRRAILRDHGEGHVCIIAPARSGKGIGCVIPTLHTWPASVVIMDVKGENFRLTAGRRKELGHVVLKFDPTADGSCCFNPFDEIPIGTPDEWGEIDNIATSLLDPRGRGAAMDSHWDRQGVGWVGAVLCHLLYAEQDKTLRGLAHLIAGLGVAGQNDRGIMRTIERIRDTRHTATGPHPDVAREMQMMLDKSPNERSGIISTVQGFLKIYRDPRIAAATSRSDFRIADLMNHEKPVSLYLVIPVKDMDRLQPLLRLMLNQIVKGLTPRMEGKTPRWKLLLMLDEFCVLGHMELLSKMLPFVPGYGIRACVVAQNLTQIEAAYGRDQPIVQSCETLLALTPNRDDFQTAKFLSDLAGDTTVVEAHRSWNSNGRTVSEQKTRRALITPGEVLELPTSKALIFKRGVKPILADQFVYYRDVRFLKWSELKPPAESDRIRQGIAYEVNITEVPKETPAIPSEPATLIDLAPAHWRNADD